MTGPARTLLDVASCWSLADLWSLVDAAVVAGLVTPAQLRSQVDRRPGRRGCARLRHVLDAGSHGGRWSSALEREVERVLRGSGLPPHEREVVAGNVRIDFAWPQARVGIEADGRLWHSTHTDFARDRRKHNRLVAEGWRIVRVTWSDVRDRPDEVVRETKRLLRASLIL